MTTYQPGIVVDVFNRSFVVEFNFNDRVFKEAFMTEFLSEHDRAKLKEGVTVIYDNNQNRIFIE